MKKRWRKLKSKSQRFLHLQTSCLVAICQNKQRQSIIKSQLNSFSKIPDLDLSESYSNKLF